MPNSRSHCRLFALALTLWAVALSPAPAHAELIQGSENWRGWCTVIPGQVGSDAFQDCRATPLDACQAQYDWWAHPELFPQLYFIGYEDTPYWWSTKKCKWNWRPGWGVAPSLVVYHCADPNASVPPGRCAPPNENFAVRDVCRANGGGTPGVSTPFPIGALTGNKALDARDFVTSEPGLSIARSYNSARYGFGYSYAYYPFRGDPLGFANWLPDFAFEVQISKEVLDVVGQVGLVAPDGGFYAFKKQSNGSLAPFMGSSTAAPQLDYSLELLTSWPADLSAFTNSVSRWRMVDPDDGIWTLETSADPVTGKYITARPISHVARGGRARTFMYGARGELLSITNQFGRSLNFTWIYSDPADADRTGPVVPRAISQIELPNHDRLVYLYEVVGTNGTGMAQAERLKSVEHRNAASSMLDRTTYLYSDSRFPTNVTDIQDRNGALRWQVEYDFLGRALTSKGPDAASLFSVAYGNPGSNFTRTVTSPLGGQTIYRYLRTSTYYDVKASAFERQATANAPAATSILGYGTNKLLSSFTDAEGRVTRYTRDARGLETSRTEGHGTPQARTVTTAWHPTLRVPTQIVEPGLTTSFTYDSNGNLLTRVQTDTTSQAVPYSTNGQQRTWTYTYTAQGQLDRIDGPLAGSGDTMDYDYDANGLLSKITDPAGNVISITSVDAAGRPLSVLDPNGVVTALVYDSLGRLTSVTESPGAGQRQMDFQYDARGRVTQVTLPAGGTLSYTYDSAGRVTEARNNFDETISYTYNTAGQATQWQIEDAGSTVQRTQTLAYDEIGRLLRIVGAGSQTETYGYDRSDLPVSRTDPRAKIFSQAYDSVSRLIRETNPDNESTQYTYDGRNSLATQSDARSLVTTFIRNGFGDVIRETSPDRGATTFWYDSAGNAIRKVDAENVETLLTYDSAGRLLTRSFPASASLNQIFTYDDTTAGNRGKGRLTGASDHRGTRAFVYDDFGSLARETRTINGHLHQVDFSYNPNGGVEEITYPSGRQVRYVRDVQDRVTAVETRKSSADVWSSVASGVAWRPFGPLERLDYGNGLHLEIDYDQNYWLTGIAVTGGPSTTLGLTFGRDAAGSVTSILDAVNPARSASFTYTQTGRLQSATSGGVTTSWTYDAAGNRTRETRSSGTTSFDEYIYPASSNRLTEIRDQGGVLQRDFLYRQNGQPSTDTRTGTGTFEYEYDAHGRLSEVSLNGAPVASYGYDGDGRRITREVAGAPGVSREYLYLPDGRLLAEADGTGTVVREYVWLDDLPLAAVDVSGSSATLYYIHAGHRSEPLAMTDGSKAKAWDASVSPFGAATIFTATTSLDLRLPGQQLQAETGLYQNWMRDYDPALGRYIEPDPIGLDGGPNVYSYVGQDPLSSVDPNGEAIVTIGPRLELTPGVGFLVGYGIAISFPTPDDPCADWDIGLFGTISGRLGLAGGFSIGSFQPTGSVNDLGGASFDGQAGIRLGSVNLSYAASAPIRGGQVGQWSHGPRMRMRPPNQTGAPPSFGPWGGRAGFSGGLNFTGVLSANRGSNRPCGCPARNGGN